MKILKPKVHGVLDYVVGIFLLLSPSLFGFSQIPAALCYVFGAAVLGLSLLTAYPLGAIKFIPFTVHGSVELISSFVMVFAPGLFGFSGESGARGFFITAGVALFLVWLLTDYKAAGPKAGMKPERVQERERETVLGKR
ncbi:MAG: hypothetical protein HY548_04800 [Elusimicrobia bacterium]|nr:hypothetical protein [Elusimicrobiota bacterium]